MNKVNGFLYGLLSSASFGLIPLFTIPAMQQGMGFWSILLYRFLFAMLALAGILLLDKQSFRIRRKEILPLLLLACLYDSSAVFLFWGYQFMSSGVATTLHFMYPVLTTLIMMIFFHEKKSLWRMAAIALAVAGVFFLSNGDGTGSVTWSGIFIVLLSALGYALYLVTVSQLKNLEMKGLKMTFYVFLFGGILLFTGTEISGIGLQAIPDRTTLGNLVMLALVPTVISNLTLLFITLSLHHLFRIMTVTAEMMSRMPSAMLRVNGSPKMAMPTHTAVTGSIAPNTDVSVEPMFLMARTSAR